MGIYKKFFFFLPVFLLSALFLPAVLGKNNEAGAQNNGNRQQTQQQTQLQLSLTGTPTVTGAQIRNQNQIRNQENEGTSSGRGEGLTQRNEKALENMSEVAKYVQELLQTRTTGGIGEQVRQIARSQNQAQEEIQEQLHKLDTKGKLARLLTGTDFGAIKNIKAQLEQNRVRIQQLEKLQTKLTNQADLKTIREAIQAMIEANASLQERIGNEEQAGSLFGWLFKFFNR